MIGSHKGGPPARRRLPAVLRELQRATAMMVAGIRARAVHVHVRLRMVRMLQQLVVVAVALGLQGRRRLRRASQRPLPSRIRKAGRRRVFGREGGRGGRTDRLSEPGRHVGSHVHVHLHRVARPRLQPLPEGGVGQRVPELALQVSPRQITFRHACALGQGGVRVRGPGGVKGEGDAPAPSGAGLGELGGA